MIPDELMLSTLETAGSYVSGCVQRWNVENYSAIVDFVVRICTAIVYMLQTTYTLFHSVSFVCERKY